MERRQIFDTTLYDEATDLAFGVMTIPFIGMNAPDLPTFLGELELRPIAEVPNERLSDALSALLATADVADAVAWLLDPPEPVRLLRPDDVAVEVTSREGVSQLRERKVGAPAASARAEPSPPRLRVERIEKTTHDARELNTFASAAVRDALVPLQRSPLDFHAFSELLDEDFRAFVVTLRSNPLVLVYTGGAGLLFYSVVRIVRGGVSGVAVGLRYRAMKRFGVPDDIIRAQFGAPPAEPDQK